MMKFSGLKKQRTFRMSRWNTSSFFIALLTVGCLLAGCASQPTMPTVSGPLEKFYSAKFDSVWKAIHTVVKYPLANENQDAGIVESEYIKAADGWHPPEMTEPPSSGQRYKIIVRVIKGQISSSNSIKVSVEKKVEIQRDFFSEPEQLKSDGLEEKSILYRIDRELLIEKAINKTQSKSAAAPPL